MSESNEHTPPHDSLVELEDEQVRDASAAPGGPSAAPKAAPEPDRFAELKAEKDRIHDRLLRTAADFDNFRKRSRREVEDAYRKGREEVLREILPMVDNLERAVEVSHRAEDIKAIVEGIEMVLRSFEDIAQRLDLERVDAVGLPFDPNVHDAIQQAETDEQPPGTVMSEILAGYRLGGKLLRAAMVVVARPPSAPGDDDAS